MSYKLPKIDISKSANIWINAIYQKMKIGEKVDYRDLISELADILPTGFAPDEIDKRLLKQRVSLTLLGIWNIDPDSELLPKTDIVIRCITNLLKRNPELWSVGASQIAEQTSISIEEVRVILLLITLLGSPYWSGATPPNQGYGLEEIKVEGYDRLENYCKYQGIEKAILDFVNQDSQGSSTSPKAFVAMWFGDSMLEVFNNYIKEAIEKEGYTPFIISMKEHNEDICDNIIAEIRNSKFIIADFTGQRGGVYFEAGFALGLGLPVIWTCREDWFKGTVDKEVDAIYNGDFVKVTIKEERNTHFDVEHFNFIVWKDGLDLYNKLKIRIAATII